MKFDEVQLAARSRLLKLLGIDLNSYTAIEYQPVALEWVSSRKLIYESELTRVPTTISGYGYNHVSHPRYLYKAQDVVSTGRQGYLFREGRLIAESSAWPPQNSLVTAGNPRKLRKMQSFESSAIVMPQSPYYHWLIEDLPAFLVARAENPAAKVVTHINPPSYVEDFLAQFESGNVLFFKDSIRLGLVNFVSKNSIIGVPQAADVKTLEARFVGASSPEKNLYLYVSRRNSSRPLANERELEAELSRRGVQVIAAQNLSFQQQVDLFSKASGVLAPHGAGLANTAFMSRGFVLEILSPSWPNPCFEILAQKKGLRFARVLSDAQTGYVSIKSVLDIFEQLSESKTHPD